MKEQVCVLLATGVGRSHSPDTSHSQEHQDTDKDHSPTVVPNDLDWGGKGGTRCLKAGGWAFVVIKGHVLGRFALQKKVFSLLGTANTGGVGNSEKGCCT